LWNFTQPKEKGYVMRDEIWIIVVLAFLLIPAIAIFLWLPAAQIINVLVATFWVLLAFVVLDSLGLLNPSKPKNV
jgi:fatty acid desaturase